MPPLCGLDSKGRPTGIYVDLLNYIAHREGWDLLYVNQPWNKLLEQTKENKLDLLVPLAITPNRANDFEYTNNFVLQIWTSVYVSLPSSIETIYDLESKTVGAIKNDINFIYFMELCENFGIKVFYEFYDDYEAIFSSLTSEDKIQAAVCANVQGIYYEEYFKIKRTPIALHPFKIYFAMGKNGDLPLIEIIDDWMTLWKNMPRSTSIYYRTLEKYFGIQRYKVPTYLTILLASLPISLALIFLVLTYTHEKLKSPSIISFIYLVFSSLWILFSDQLLVRFAFDDITLTQLQTAKGMLFVGVTAILIFILIKVSFYREKEKETIIKSVFETTPIGLGVINCDRKVFERVNTFLSSITGFTEKELIGKEVLSITNDENLRALYEKMNQTKQPISLETQVSKKDKTVADVIVAAAKLEGPNKAVLACVDIGDRKRVEIKLLSEKEKFHKFVEILPYGFEEIDLTGTYLYVNEALCNILRYKREEILGSKVYDYNIDPDIGDSLMGDIVNKIEPIPYFVKKKTKGGRAIDVRVDWNYRVSDETQKIEGVIAVVSDITEKMLAENRQELMIKILQLLNSEQSLEKEPGEILREILDLIRSYMHFEVIAIRLKSDDSFPFYAIDGLPKAIVNNVRYVRIRNNIDSLFKHTECLGKEGGTICNGVGHGIFDTSKPYYTDNGSFWSNEFQDMKEFCNHECHRIGFQSICIVPLRSGKEQQTIIGLIQVFDSRKDMLTPDTVKFFEGIGNSIGITLARKLYQEELISKESRYRSVVETAGNIIIVLSSWLKIMEFNKAAERTYKTKRENAIGKNYLQLFVERKYWRPVLEDVQRVLLGNPLVGFTNIAMVEGERRFIYWNVSRVEDRTLNEDCVVAVGSDITNDIRRKKLLMKQDEQIRQAQKMDAIGKLAGGIAHNFNNLLMGILGNISLMQANPKLMELEGKTLKEIEYYINNAVKMTRQLLGFARSGKYDVKTYDLNGIAEESVTLFTKTRKEIFYGLNFTDNLWKVDVDKSQIDQVLLNLFINSAHAMPSGGKIMLNSQNVIFGDDDKKIYERPPGRYAKLSITDEGIGIPKENLSRIFEPFFTTRGTGKGTGLGLASAYGIIKNHGGAITVYSEVGQGTTFNIYLPASASQDEESQHEARHNLVTLGKNELILLVDDEEFVRSAGEKMLERLGYRVISVNSGKRAIEKFSSHATELSLVILDIVMPEMEGGEVFDRLREINKTIPILLSSGYSINGKAQAIMDRGCEGFIQKPFSLMDLSEKITELLN